MTEAHRRWLTHLVSDPVRATDLSFALRVTDELSPSPASAHTALVVLRSALARALSVSEEELFTAVELFRPSTIEDGATCNDPL